MAILRTVSITNKSVLTMSRFDAHAIAADPVDSPTPPNAPLHVYEKGMQRIVSRVEAWRYDEFYMYVTKHRTTMSAMIRRLITEEMARNP